MKKLLSFFIIFCISLNIFAGWRAIESKDEFGDSTGIYHLMNIAEGTYIDDDFNSQKCYLRFIVEPEGNPIIRDKWIMDSFRIELIDKNLDIWHPLNRQTEYTLKIKDSNKIVHKYNLDRSYIMGAQGYEILNLASNQDIKLIIELNDTTYLFKIDTSNFNNALYQIQQNSIKNNIPHGSYNTWERHTYSSYSIDLLNSIDQQLTSDTLNEVIYTLSSSTKIDNQIIGNHIFLSKEAGKNQIACSISIQNTYDDIFYYKQQDLAVKDITFDWNTGKKTFYDDINLSYGTNDLICNLDSTTTYFLSNAQSVQYIINYNYKGSNHKLVGTFSGENFKTALQSLKEV